ncbi:chitinase N-terminal domain-containing protein [Microbacterium sp. M3]|uniref:galactosylceramidase n=1 Tax=Microbacterium arthrosphaerae TaxID=792652 RepID=A0ABU4H2Z1_9MICO|nr:MULTISPECIES: chitinase N-terminal domain-containing protein [Microbacterium]MDW4573688.1 chitinase N-terminal domain-containing protein [Microbacterium arthrosphaerae]MDW7607543.1 chitinase N-terminal domain-containing protein [Microbacterium sp. M3]
MVTAAVIAAPLAVPPAAQAAVTDPVVVTVNGADVAAAAQNRNGLTFKGFGVLTANSTSALLLDYKAQHPEKYWELIETLFGGDHPIMNTVKIEMGNDRNTSTGPNPATMRSRDEYPNVLREPGFQLAADAQHVAHGDVHVSILRWNRPAWVQNDADQYIWFKNTVLAAYREFGIMVDSINPDSNETTNPNIPLYKSFSGWLRNDTKGYEGASAADPNNGFVSLEEGDLYRAIDTVAADTVGTPPVSFGNAMTSATDPSLRDAVDVVGFHYSSADDSAGNMKKIAEQLDLEVWNSEGQSTFSSSADRPNNNASDEQGGFGTQFGGTNSALEMGNWVTTGFSASRRTLNIFQPVIGSFYDGFQYSSKELVNAREPWSGWLYYDGGLSVIEQFTQFAKLGWENDDNTAGIWRAIPQASKSELGTGNPPGGARAGGASYTTLAAPDASDFSTVVINDSKFTKTYRIVPNGLSLGSDQTAELWETRAADDGEAYDANYLRPIGEVAPSADGSYTVTIKPFSALTFTTLDHATTGADGTVAARDGYGSSLPTTPEYTDADGGRDVLDTDESGYVNGVTDDAVLYADDFDYAEQGTIKGYDPETRQLVDTGETFLESRGGRDRPAGTPALQSEDYGVTPRYTNDTNGAFESVATADAAHDRVLRQQVGPGMAGGAWNAGDPKTTIGDARWANYTVSADVLFEATGAQYATLGAREQGGTANGQNVSAAELRVDPAGAWTFMRFGTTLSSGSLAATPAAGFRAGAGAWNNLAVKVAGNVYTAYVNGVEIASYTDAAPQAAGRIQLGSSFNFVQFDNLKVETVPGYTPYYDSIIDGMHQTSWADTSVPVLEFDAAWSHVNGQGMFEWQRTASKSTAKGATMTYTFTGTGLDIIGTNPGTATLDVIVDGVQIAAAAPTFSAGSERTTFVLRGLADGEHTVALRTANDASINVDAVGVITATADAAQADTAALTAALAAVGELDEADYSAETWAVFAAVLGDARAAVDDPQQFGLDTEGAVALAARLTAAADGLVPKDVSADVLDLGVLSIPSNDRTLPAELTLAGTEAKVTWSLSSIASAKSVADLGSFAPTGRSTEKLPSGVYQRFSATVLVTPADLEYFIDSGAAGPAEGSVYAGVAASFPDLLNDTADQKWDGVAAGETWGYSTAATAAAAGTPRDWGSSYVGVDYNKPVTYHLTLPAGSYNIVAVQAPRAGLTTNVYSKVRAAGAETTKTAVSNGAATPVAQTLTLDADAVIDVEFGTTGTSGYNARLALVYVQSLPRDLGVVSALGADDELPETVIVAGTERAVEWDAASAAQPRSEYAKLTVTGRLTDTDQAVVAGFEIVPPALVYYIDAGTGGVASPQYTAVAGAVTLRNDKVDQVSAAADQWGYVADGMKTKGTTDINDKYSTGLYQDTTRLIYRLPLDAGTYTLTGGFTEWWNLSRTMNHTVSVAGTELAKGNIPLSGTNTPLAAGLTFTLSAPATVDYVVTNEGAGGERPVISWLAVADQTLPGAPQNVTATLAGDTSVKVSWDAAALAGPGFTGYRVYEAGGAEPVCETSETTCTVKDLELGSTHAYEVAGVNRIGEGARSAATASVTLPEVASDDGAKSAPAKGVLSSNDGWDTGLKDGTFQLTMNLWWGENGSLFKLYRDGELVAKVPLTMMSPGAQRAVVDIEGLPNGTYVFTGELLNSKGTTATQPLTVKVTDASPGKPVLSAPNKDGDGTYTVTANLWWGTNATSYRFLENGAEIGAGQLTAKTPEAQRATLAVEGKAAGTYTYTVEFTNAAGTTVSAPVKVTVSK